MAAVVVGLIETSFAVCLPPSHLPNKFTADLPIAELVAVTQSICPASNIATTSGETLGEINASISNHRFEIGPRCGQTFVEYVAASIAANEQHFLLEIFIDQEICQRRTVRTLGHRRLDLPQLVNQLGGRGANRRDLDLRRQAGFDCI